VKFKLLEIRMSKMLLIILMAMSSSMSFGGTVSVLDNASGVDTPCGNDRTANLAQPWVASTWKASKAYAVRLTMDSLISGVSSDGVFTVCMDSLISALDKAQALNLPASLTLFSGMAPAVVDYGIAHGEQTWVFVDQNPNHPGFGVPVTRLVPWSETATRSQAAIFDAIKVAAAGRLTYISVSPLHGMRYLRVIAGENDVTTLPGYSRSILESTVKTGYAAANGIAPLHVHEIYNVQDSQGSLSDLAVAWAKEAGAVGIFVENLKYGYPTCQSGQGKIMCEAGLSNVLEMVSPLGTTFLKAVTYGKSLAPNLVDIRVYVDDANTYGSKITAY
jgi:hypothetical protein